MLAQNKNHAEFNNQAINKIKETIEEIIWDYLEQKYGDEYEIADANVDELVNIIIHEIKEVGLEKVHITQVIDENLVGIREFKRVV